MVTFVECVREDSRVSRPYAAECLEEPALPHDRRADRGNVAGCARFRNYPDIERTEASNGDVYYYSTQYLESGYAASLAEYDAVERPCRRIMSDEGLARSSHMQRKASRAISLGTHFF